MFKKEKKAHPKEIREYLTNLIKLGEDIWISFIGWSIELHYESKDYPHLFVKKMFSRFKDLKTYNCMQLHGETWCFNFYFDDRGDFKKGD